MVRPMVIGLTGPTGAGKSTVAAAFASLGCEVIDCDKIAREITSTPACLLALQRAFGADVVRAGHLDRTLLAERAFSDAASSQKLNAVTHPLIMEEVQQRIAACDAGAKAVIVDAALLFESGADTMCDRTVAVVAKVALRLVRIMSRDALTEEQARARMDAQQPNEYYTARASYVMDGGITISQVPQETEKLLHLLLPPSS